MEPKRNIFHLRQFSIDQTHAGMKVGTDSDLLGTMAYGGDRVLDIGAGTGIITLMLAQRYPEARFTAVEIDDNAVIDASVNFASSPWSDRITLVHDSFQHYLSERRPDEAPFDAVVCNPPYFDRSLECPDQSRLRARHSSSLPFEVLIEGASSLLKAGGFFSVCIPPEVLDDFLSIGAKAGFCVYEENRIQALPDNPAKRYVLIFQKMDNETGEDDLPTERPIAVNHYCMRNADHTYSDWYRSQLKDFLTGRIFE